MAKRPDYGKQGRVVRLKSNYFKISKFPSVSIYHYNFDSTPKASKAMIERIYVHVSGENRFSDYHAVFDGNSAIYSATPLPLENERRGTRFTVNLTGRNGETSKDGSYNVTIRFIQLLNLDELKRHISGGSVSPNEVTKCITALNTYINYSVRQRYLTVGRAIYPDDPRGRPIILSRGFELKKGFYQSLRPGTNCLAINVDVCVGVFYAEDNVLNVACGILGKRSKDEFRRGMTEIERIILLRHLRGLKIRVTHQKQRKPVYTIKNLSTDSASGIFFHHEKEDREVSVAEYFHLTYGRKLEFEGLPCIKVNKDVFLPFEVCEVLKGQRSDGSLPDTTLADVIKHACIKPRERFDRILHSVREIFRYNGDPFLKSIGMGVEPCSMLVEGHVLQPPVLEYHPKSVNPVFTPEAGRWNITNKVVALGKKLQNWSVLVYANEKNHPKPIVRCFMQKFREVANQKGICVVNEPKIYYSNPNGEVHKSFYQACCLSRFNKDLPPQLIFCIVERVSPLYGEIKRIGDTELGVPTQVMLAKQLSRNSIDQLCANVALKVNVKLGGQNYFLSKGQLGFVSEVPTMIFGADVYHSGRGENKPSIAAVCSSMDIDATEYCSRYSKNKESRNETIENLQEMVDDLLHAFWERNDTLPQRILFYRDGVAEGQFEHVLHDEVKVLKACFENCYKKGFEPKLTFCTPVSHHFARLTYRFMPSEPRDGDKNGNCPPGTIVDNSILVPQEFGFYLQPHNVLQGTGRPIRYNVLYDENNFTADGIQALTHKLCYLSSRFAW
ncbi:17220_t:CDS:10 [Acaulospora colombiana]|uniref:17220_t:CDS:1 n=1 Tax=Acaulospora colombiana TaxID=27376 RepID=A0ACA9K407_9GLOM|nr:17220_t:CDS:10 [Acaulospora colombiana]